MAFSLDEFLDGAEHDTRDHSGVTNTNPAQVSGPERTAGTEATLRSFSPLDVATMAGIHSPANGESVGVATGMGLGVDAVVAIPGGTLAADDDYLVFEVWGVDTGAAGDTVAIALGATTIGNLGTGGGVDQGEEFYIRGTILRTGASAQIAISIMSSGPTTGERECSRGTATEDLSTALNLTASDGANGITFDALIVRKWTT
jgi:hypothetical protein